MNQSSIGIISQLHVLLCFLGANLVPSVCMCKAIVHSMHCSLLNENISYGTVYFLILHRYTCISTLHNSFLTKLMTEFFKW